MIVSYSPLNGIPWNIATYRADIVNGLSLIQFVGEPFQDGEHKPERLEIKLVYVVERRIRRAFNYSSLEHNFGVIM